MAAVAAAEAGGGAGGGTTVASHGNIGYGGGGGSSDAAGFLPGTEVLTAGVQTGNGYLTINVVPEPASIALLGAGLGLLRRRANREPG